MQLIEVTPLSRGIGKDTLSYYTAKPVLPGMLVSVPVRSRVVPALVMRCRDVRDSKTELRSAGYGLKKIKHIHKNALYPASFMRAAESIAPYFATTAGAVLEALTPRAILEEATQRNAAMVPEEEPHVSELVPVKTLLQAPEEERIAAYKSLIREEFARRQSVFLCMPTVHAAETVIAALGRGIEEYTYILHGELSKKEQLARWQGALSDEHAVLVIATGGFLSIPRSDIRTYIIESEGSSAYKHMRRPYLDIRTATEHIARERGAKLLWGDFPLRTETIYRRDQGEFTDFSPLKFRALTQAETKLINMARDSGEDEVPAGRQREFSVLGNELQELVKTAYDSSERLFVLAGRRGLYPVTVCNDCGEVVVCERCVAPVVLHRKENDKANNNIFICHACGTKYESEDRCGNCSSWRLAPLGIGAERVAEAVAECAPTTQVFRIDGDATPTRKKIRDTMQRFSNAPGSVLVGTQMVLPYLSDIPNIAVASIDALFTRSDFRMHEKLFRMFMRIRSIATKRFYVQTRMPYMPLFENSLQGNIIEFYRTEVAQRKRFGYPPFSVIIKISVSGTRENTAKAETFLQKRFAEYAPTFLYAPHHERASAKGGRGGGKQVLHAIIRVPREAWPDEHLCTLLASLPPSVAINIDPEEIL